MKILHPTDFSRAAEKARVLAIDLTARLSGTLHLTHVQERFHEQTVNPYTLSGGEQLRHEVLERMRELQELETRHLRERLANLSPDGATWELRWGKTIPELLDMASDHDLIVMGAHGNNPLDNYFLGGIAGRLVRRSCVPVLTVRETSEILRVGRLLLATDFGYPSQHAWKWCQAWREAGIEINVVHILSDASSKTDTALRRLEEFVDKVSVRQMVRNGDLATRLPEIAQEVAADVIVVGVQRRRSALGLLLGSRADALIRSSHIPILAIPYDDK